MRSRTKRPKCWCPADSGDYMSIVLPNPLPPDITDRLSNDGIERTKHWWDNPYLVFHDSPRRARAAVECLAWYFQREKHYDFVQYGADDKDDKRDVALLWCDDGLRPAGAACFRYRQYRKDDDSLTDYTPSLSWVWFHPYLRGRSYRMTSLAESWPQIRQLFPGDLAIESPISESMLGVLRKVGEKFVEGTIFLEVPSQPPASAQRT